MKSIYHGGFRRGKYNKKSRRQGSASARKGKQMRRKIKDTVFTKMFNEPKYSLDLYKALHPEDKAVTVDDIKTTTLDPILTNGIYNDLSFLVRDKLIILVEAQSTWSVNILWRHFFYLAETYKNLIGGNEENLHSTQKVYFPIPEMYVIYTGEKKDVPKTMSLKEEFLAPNASLDLIVKVITNSEKYDIINQYIRFAHKVDYYRKQPGDSHTKAIKVLEECINEGILVEFFKEHRAEVLEIMSLSFLFDPDYIYKSYDKSLIEQGRQEGRAEGMNTILEALIAKGVITREFAEQTLAEETGVVQK